MEHLLPSGSDPFDGAATDPLGGATAGGPFTGAFGTFGTVVLVLLALVGLAVVLGGVRSLVRARRRAVEVRAWTTGGRTTTGTVVDNRLTSHRRAEPHGTGTGLTFSPVVRFEADGREVTVAGDQVSHRSFLTGRPARVVYDPADPERAHVVAEGGGGPGARAGGFLLVGVGVVFLVGLAVVAGLASSVL